MTKTFIAKKIVTSIVGFGTSTIAQTIIKNNVPTETTFQVISVNSASAVIGLMASDATSSWTDAKIDEAVNWWKTNVTKTNK